MARIPDYVKVIDLPSGRRYEVRPEVTGADGKRRQKRKRFKTLKEAVDHYTAIAGDRGRGLHVAPSELTVQEAVDSWLLGQRIRSKTMSAYVTSLRPIVDHLGNRPVQSITKDDIESVVQALRTGTSKMGTWNAPTKLKRSAKKMRSKWAATSVNPMLARTRAIFDDLVNQGIVVRNVTALVKSLPVDKAEMHTLDSDQVTALLAATADDPFAIAWLLAVYGLRGGEILAVDIDKDIDLDANTIRVDESRIAVAGGSVTGATKTVTSTRTLPMPEDLARAVRRERKRHAKLKLLLGSKWTDTGLLVVDELGNPPHPDTLTAAWRRALANAELPHVRLHDARHSCATLMHLNRVPVVVIAGWLGHQDPGFTLRTYAHSTNDALAEAAAMLGTITARKTKDAQ
ncbi:site-specific integrase [Mycobacteroides abscessus]|uniref:site-specific integrase n=1 Tax=Mycobacteroides abscessus TaxID=36809 RepID=UPI0009A5C89D|nr:tyrosine-type recombinase/integrase [Mycobacteroides abscessus]MBN7442622.1 site-specific integrase [Mycobacteroides abscessus subsp. abscessus]SKR62300.1 putative site-specific recombinase [Mycobacteroides abscessus subsp. abscessus]SLH64549.1 gp41 protein [Mycobacteroides abscessus subsp. abscessus]